MPERRNDVSQHRPSTFAVGGPGRQSLGEPVEPGDDLRHVAQEGRVVEARVELGERQPLGDRRIDREQVAQRRALVGGPERGALDDRVGVLARHRRPRRPARRRTRDEAWRPSPRAMFSRIRSERTMQPVDQAGHPDEHVVEQDRRVGQDDPLGARMADVALVPERLVLERGVGVAAQQPGETGDPLGQDRVALVGHRRRALLAGLERLLDLADLGVLEVADLGREALQRATDDGDRGQQRGVAVALDDLGADRVGMETEVGSTSASISGSRWL